ncbi:Uncharacterised protein [Clostridioides difficile]|uniref:hypothetical protein n=1 Tax=Clostridioides difficile TaxID=1496 RepID=UPI001025FEDD|nr:hypothetical protein [Clostridioides difficile]UWD43081.1 hypothetical protein NYF05_08910 [Clostridioides difficile]UWD46669.1 hypothetical protein NYU56_08655 [Clostridioides difficile]VFF94947.1 Uncharacterised protein [Clostridioides difficile]VIG16923.1 Uncharacterised protein [Clostridioides difficile]
MAFYVIERTIKKRRGCYSESDIHISPCYLKDRNYYGSYNLSNIKNINIPEKTKVVINSFEAYYLAGGEYNEKIIIKDCTIRQDTTIELIPDPIISISNDLGYISYAQSINYKITDSDPTTRFKIVYKLNDVVISEKYNTTDSNYTIDLTEEHLSKLSFKSKNNITIELSTSDGGVFLTKTITFTKGNTKPKLNISSYGSNSATFTAIDIDNNLSKIEWYLDDVLKETITTDLTTEKTINYELTDNAIHTLKIVATDAENATAEKVLSISKEIMPLQSDATLQDISTKLTEIGEGFKNGKTSIINTLALKNIEASLNNTLVELSEKIKTSFDSSDASIQDLMSQLTQANNTITQLNTQINGLNSKYKYAYSTDVTLHWFVNCGFKPDFVIYHCWTKSTQLLTIATPDKYFSFMNSSRGWAIIQSDPNDEYSFSKNDTTRYFGTVFRDNGFYCSNMPNDSLNDKYYFYYAIKCL